MNCCINCFVSNYLKQIIVGGEIGNCDYCNSKDINVYNPSELSKFFVKLILKFLNLQYLFRFFKLYCLRNKKRYKNFLQDIYIKRKARN